MHTIWKGSISFGLVNIPISLFAATENNDIRFRSLHKECHNPIKYEKVCPVCEKDVGNDDLVKGYEYEPGKFVVIDKEDLEDVAPESNKMVEIMDFINLDEIDPIFFDRSYFLGPRDNGLKSYSLLKRAMEDTGKIGLAKITIRSKESLAVVRMYKDGLLLETIHFPEEVRNAEMVPGVSSDIELNEKEVTMAVQLIEQLTTTFDPEKYTNEYRTTLMELIESKANGEDIKVSKEKPKENVVDLMEALQASIDKSKTEDEKKQQPKRKKAPVIKKKKAAATE